ncbi:MAG: response regulator [Rhodospirillales bacterium]|nr:response regulator [Rhodospirillales bacterium]
MLDNSWQHRDLAVEALGQLGVENILPCSTPGEALQKMSKFKPDLIFMEINLQRSAGLNFLRRVRAGQSHADVDVPVILTSLSVERVMMTKAAEAGFENFVRKPFNIETVQQRVSGTLDNPDRVVLASDYFGPNRREDGRTSEYSGKDRRQTVMKVSVSYEASPETAKRSSRNEAASADSTASNQNQQTEPAQEENIKPAASLRREAPPPPVKLVAIEPPLKEIPANEAPVKPAARPPVKARPEVPAMSAEEKAKQKIKDEMADHALWLTSKGAKGQKANFRGADLSGMDLSGAELASAGLRDAIYKIAT